MNSDVPGTYRMRCVRRDVQNRLRQTGVARSVLGHEHGPETGRRAVGWGATGVRLAGLFGYNIRFDREACQEARDRRIPSSWVAVAHALTTSTGSKPPTNFEGMMELHTRWIEYASDTTVVPAYLARPNRVAGPLPAIIVIQEVWGVDDHIRDLVHRFATAGYLAAAPDLYAHGGRRPDTMSAERAEAAKRALDAAPPAAWSDPAARAAALSHLPEKERHTVLATIAALLNPDRPIAQYVDDLYALASHLRAAPDECTGRIGSVGYCLGGMLSALLAGRDAELDGAVIYYGHAPDMAQLRNLRAPLLGFYGAEDTRITSGVGPFEETLRAEGRSLEAHVYPDTPHAFFNDTRPSYRVNAARDAWARTLMFFDQQLASAGD